MTIMEVNRAIDIMQKLLDLTELSDMPETVRIGCAEFGMAAEEYYVAILSDEEYSFIEPFLRGTYNRSIVFGDDTMFEISGGPRIERLMRKGGRTYVMISKEKGNIVTFKTYLCDILTLIGAGMLKLSENDM